MDSWTCLQYWCAVALIIVLTVVTHGHVNRTQVHVPIVGPSGAVSSYIGALKFVKDGKNLVNEGYAKYRYKLFKVADLTRWRVFLSGSKLVEEVVKLPETTASGTAAIVESTAAEFTFGLPMIQNPYHMPVLRQKLTQNLGALFPALVEEIGLAFEQYIPFKGRAGDGWITVKALETMMLITCRTTNRAFVGAPMCRNPDYMNINISYTKDVFIGAQIIRIFPRFLKPFAARFLTNVPKRVRATTKYLRPIINDRYRLLSENEHDWDELPNDLLSWLMKDAKGVETEPESLARRILVINVAAIHTTSMSMTTALYYLAAYPQYVEPLREEINAAVRTDGWTREAMAKCVKLDSFLKETFRLHGLGAANVSRLAVKDFTLSDGTFIPKNTLISFASAPFHRDPEIYGPNAANFDGFRFCQAKESTTHETENDSEKTKQSMTSTSFEYLPFGVGRHACPGRFFAANEIKVMTSYVLMNYDIKFDSTEGLKEGQLPEEDWYGLVSVPNPRTKLQFKKRNGSDLNL